MGINKNLIKNKSGQAVVEMAIFGSIILFLLGILVSYIQRLNDQQYVQMEAFRRTLQKACTNQGIEVDGAGASVQLTLLQNRRHVEVSENFKKGSASTSSASSSVFWAVPKAETGVEPENMVILRVNEDEHLIQPDDDFTGFDKINTTSASNYEEEYTKTENNEGINTTRKSELSETVSTDFIDEDGNSLWSTTQGVYRDANGQYRYSASNVEQVVERGRTWDTEF